MYEKTFKIVYDMPEVEDFDENKEEIVKWCKEQNYLDLNVIDAHSLAREVEDNFCYYQNYYTRTEDPDGVETGYDNIYENIRLALEDAIYDCLEPICKDVIAQYKKVMETE